MANYKLVLSYDGSRYKGWQRLGKNEFTVQGIVEDTISSLLNCPVEIHGSGRTDAGVHARGQVANLKIPFLLKDAFRDELNEKLPEDIRLIEVMRVPGEFHARYSAVSKEYRYYVDLKEKPSVFSRKYACHFPEEIDMNAMCTAVVYLIGTHDFTSFTDDKTDKDKVRTVYGIQILEKNGLLEFIYQGDGFLQHMVRILSGTLLEVGSGKIRPEDMKNILEAKERARAGFMAPAKGLFLEKVNYE